MIPSPPNEGPHRVPINSGNTCGTAYRAASAQNRVADHAAQILFGRLMVRAGRRHHVLLDHDAADVVAAEPQPQLAGFQALGHPGRSARCRIFSRYIREMASVLQVLDRGRLFLDEPAERGVLALESPRDERREAAGLFLRSGARSRDGSRAARWSRRSRTSWSRWSACRAGARCGERRSTPASSTSAG